MYNMIVIFVVIALCVHKATSQDEADIQTLIKELQRDIGTLTKHVLSQDTIIRANHDTLKKLADHATKQDLSIDANRATLKKLADHAIKQDLTLKKLADHAKQQDTSLDGLSKQLRQQDVKDDVRAIKGILTSVLPGKTEGRPAPSCAWLDERHYNLKDGHYWTLSEGRPMYNYCSMDEGGIPVPTTTPVTPKTSPITTMTTPSTTPSTTNYPTTTPEPGTKHNPGVSCKVLKENHPALKSGTYWIKLTAPTKMYCDMETSEGGWTLVGKATVETETEAAEVYFENLLSDDISRLSEVTKKRFLLSAVGLQNLQTHISFSSIRWYCHKPYHGRTLHIYTSNNKLGHDVVEHMLDRSDDRPASCGSYNRLANDNSVLAQNCKKWQQQKWYGCGHNGRLYCEPMGYGGHVFYLGSGSRNVNCDDWGNELNYSPLGEWMFYVK